jgi:hypothetical protein
MKVTRWNGEPITEPGIYAGVPMEVYHGADLCEGPSISSSGLRTIFDPKRGPMEYWIFSPYNPNRLEPEEKEAFVLGRGAHHLFLGETDFAKHFTFQPETYTDQKTGEVKAWNGNATFCRQWKEHVLAEGLTILKPAQVEMIRGMAGVLPWQEGLEDSGLRNNLIGRTALKGLVEHTIVIRDEDTGVWLKARPDAIPLDSTEAVDFKTTQAVDDHSLQRTLDDYRYDMQAELVARCLREAVDLELTSFAFIFAAKSKPHCVRTVELNPVNLGEAAADNRAALRTFARCLETNRWPGPGGSVSDAIPLSRSDWSLREAAGRRAILEMELA